MARRTKQNPIHGYEDWSKLMRECEVQEEMLTRTLRCNWCGGEGTVWERDCDGGEMLVPCPDCHGLGLNQEMEDAN